MAKQVGFLTDVSLCIGCKACEVACKEWNKVPEDGLDLLGMSMDNTGMLGANLLRCIEKKLLTLRTLAWALSTRCAKA